MVGIGSTCKYLRNVNLDYVPELQYTNKTDGIIVNRSLHYPTWIYYDDLT